MLIQINSTQNARQTVLPSAGKANGQQAVDFSDLLATTDATAHYERMTMRAARESAPEEPQDVFGVEWTDEKLAILAGLKYGETIDTTNTINWQSTGDYTLTADEIAQLKENYDIENLTPQSYYDLMSALTHLNALSAKDIEGMHLKKADLGASNFMITPAQSSFRHASFSSGNILETLMNELNSLSGMRDWSMSQQFLEMNPAFQKDGALNQYQGLLGEQFASFNKLQLLFQSIKR